MVKKMQDGQINTALKLASQNGHLGVANRLLDFQKMQIREGFKILYSHGSYVPMDVIDLVIEFTLQKKKIKNKKTK